VKFRPEHAVPEAAGDRTRALEARMDTDLESNRLVKSIVRTTILAVAGME